MRNTPYKANPFRRFWRRVRPATWLPLHTFPLSIRPLVEFDPAELDSGITATQIKQLRDLSWLDAYGNIILAGPPGLGKTMIALGLGLHAINEGYVDLPPFLC